MTQRARGSQAWVNVVVRGPLFDKRITPVVKRAMVDRCLKTIDKRLRRPGRWSKRLGARKNVVTADMALGAAAAQAYTLEHRSTLRHPRTKGTGWVRKNVKIARGVAPSALKAAAREIVGELS